MAEQKKRGRGRPTKGTDKVKLVPLYLKDSDKKKVCKKFGNATNAVKTLVLPKCG